VRRSIIILILTAIIITLPGCSNYPPRATAPSMDSVFNRYDRIVIGESTDNEVLSFIQDHSLDEILSQDDPEQLGMAGDERPTLIVPVGRHPLPGVESESLLPGVEVILDTIPPPTGR